MDEGLELDDTDQVTDDQFDDEDEEEAERQSPKSSKLKSCWSWLRKWSASRSNQSKVQHEKEEDSLIPWPDKDPEGADNNPRTRVGELDNEGLDIKAGTKNSLGGSHVFDKTQYGLDDLLGMNTKVSSVEGTQGGKQQTIQALADSGASASIISWDLAKTINMTILMFLARSYEMIEAEAPESATA